MTFADAYQKWRPGFEEALDPRYQTISWLDYMVMEGRAILLHATEAAAVVEIRYYPTGNRDLHVICATGDLNDLRGEILEQMIRLACDNGCLAVLVESRRGWERALAANGFEHYKSILRKEL